MRTPHLPALRVCSGPPGERLNSKAGNWEEAAARRPEDWIYLPKLDRGTWQIPLSGMGGKWREPAVENLLGVQRKRLNVGAVPGGGSLGSCSQGSSKNTHLATCS